MQRECVTKDVEVMIKPGSRIGQGKAAVISRELTKIHRRHQKLTAALVVETATPPNHPLHDLFEWDDSHAAHHYRLEQARHMLRSITIIDERISTKPIRAYVAFQQPDELADYKPMVEALTDANYRAQLVAEARGHLASWLETYGHLEELAKECRTIRQLLKASGRNGR